MRDRIGKWRSRASEAIKSFQFSRLTKSRSVLVALVLLALALGAYFFVWTYPRRAAAHLTEASDVDRLAAETDTRAANAQIVLSVSLLIGIWLTLRRVRAIEKQAEVAALQAATAEQGQITERFTRAIELLGKAGDESLTIRLGGIYALERIMRDSDRDYDTVRSVLITFIRDATSEPQTPTSEEGSETRTKLRSDIQAAITVIGRNPPQDSDKSEVLDLTGSQLPEANLKGLCFTHAKLQNVNLDKANLEGTNFEGSDLSRASFRDARANGANFANANLCGADLTHAILIRACFQNALLRGSVLRSAFLASANLSGSDLTAADHSGADFEGAELNNIRGGVPRSQ